MTAQSNASRRTVLLLACIPTVDCVLNQLANGLHLYLGSVSILQAFRAILLLGFAAFVLAKIYARPDMMRRIPGPAIAAVVLILLWLSKQWFVVGTGEMSGYIAYGQMAYWLVMWVAVSLACETATQAMILLYGLACGALLTAFSVVLGFVFGSLNFYEDDLVSSSAGWFNTAKAITGILVCGAAVILYLGIGRRKAWLYGLLALFCLVGAMLTYARTGTVALVAVTLWLALWSAHTGDFFRWRALKWFLRLFLIAALAIPLIVQPQTLFARWGDVTEGESAGSGRAGIWNIALEGFTASPVTAQAVGSGFDSMAELLYREYGEDVRHTHNDTLDLLLVGGLVGIIWQMSFIWVWSSRISMSGLWSLEGAAMMAVFIDYFCHAQLTGQLWGTDVMNYYMIALTALTVIGLKQRSSLRVPLTTSPLQ